MKVIAFGLFPRFNFLKIYSITVYSLTIIKEVFIFINFFCTCCQNHLSTK